MGISSNSDMDTNHPTPPDFFIRVHMLLAAQFHVLSFNLEWCKLRVILGLGGVLTDTVVGWRSVLHMPIFLPLGFAGGPFFDL